MRGALGTGVGKVSPRQRALVKGSKLSATEKLLLRERMPRLLSSLVWCLMLLGTKVAPQGELPWVLDRPGRTDIFSSAGGWRENPGAGGVRLSSCGGNLLRYRTHWGSSGS